MGSNVFRPLTGYKLFTSGSVLMTKLCSARLLEAEVPKLLLRLSLTVFDIVVVNNLLEE